jgi:serine/threonine protein phosphatase PrpC
MILVCSDGFWEYVKEEEMRYFLLHFKLDKALNSMVDLAKKRGGERGDNISVGVITLFQERNKELEITEKIEKTTIESKNNLYVVPLILSFILATILLITYINI